MMANRVRPGIETLRQMSGTSSPESRMELVSAEPIKASGIARRTNRPDTRLLLTTPPKTQKVLEKQEPSTQDIGTWSSKSLLHVCDGYVWICNAI